MYIKQNVYDLKHKGLLLLIHFHNNSFSVSVFLILKHNSCKRTNNLRVSPFFVAAIKTWLFSIKFFIIKWRC